MLAFVSIRCFNALIIIPNLKCSTAMTDIVEVTRQKVNDLANSLDAESISRIPTTRDLEVIVDRKFARQVDAYRWYAHIPQPTDIYAVADVGGKRISLQRLIIALANPEKTVKEIKHVSFKSKFSFDCRLQNLLEKVGRQSVMRNRKPKRNTSSHYKGVSKNLRTNGEVFWRGQIKGDFGTMSLGAFEDEKWGATVYDAAAFLMFDGTGYYNFPDQRPDPEALEIVRIRIARFHILQARREQKQRSS